MCGRSSLVEVCDFRVVEGYSFRFTVMRRLNSYFSSLRFRLGTEDFWRLDDVLFSLLVFCKEFGILFPESFYQAVSECLSLSGDHLFCLRVGEVCSEKEGFVLGLSDFRVVEGYAFRELLAGRLNSDFVKLQSCVGTEEFGRLDDVFCSLLVFCRDFSFLSCHCYDRVYSEYLALAEKHALLCYGNGAGSEKGE